MNMHPALLHYVSPNNPDFNDGDVEIKAYGYWAISYCYGELTDPPEYGDIYSHFPQYGTDGTPTQDQQAKIDVASFEAALAALTGKDYEGRKLYVKIRGTDEIIPVPEIRGPWFVAAYATVQGC